MDLAVPQLDAGLACAAPGEPSNVAAGAAAAAAAASAGEGASGDTPSGGQAVVAKLLISNAAAGSVIGKVRSGGPALMAHGAWWRYP
jgi:hypothetical protein